MLNFKIKTPTNSYNNIEKFGAKGYNMKDLKGIIGGLKLWLQKIRVYGF